MEEDLDTADNIFNIQGTEPSKTSDFCTWNLTDLSLLSANAPKDWRSFALVGLYYQFFTTFGESTFPQATAAFQKASILNPRTAVVPYLQGELHMATAFWTKKAWASDAARDAFYRAAIPSFTRAIQLDPGFAKAYAARAEVYLNLKQDALAIKDFDKALSLKPDISTALSDRGIAHLELGQYYPAISDFGDAIRAKDEGDSYISTLYANRGDTYVKVRDYQRAIDDYSTALR
ncbi:tetratricopeptide repeat protein [Acidisarcina polymorpha]|nr:tetratricopeptide repeat protein [Acidisarcina polymorpha]